MQDDHLQGIAALLVHEKLLDKEGALYHYQQALNDTVRFPYYLGSVDISSAAYVPRLVRGIQEI